MGQFHLNFICSLLAKGKNRKSIFGPGHMTKMAAVSVYGKNVKKSSSTEPLRPVALKLGMQHLAFGIAKHHFGFVILRLQNISKFISKTNITL